MYELKYIIRFYNQFINDTNFLETKDITLKNNTDIIKCYDNLFAHGETWGCSYLYHKLFHQNNLLGLVEKVSTLNKR